MNYSFCISEMVTYKAHFIYLENKLIHGNLISRRNISLSWSKIIKFSVAKIFSSPAHSVVVNCNVKLTRVRPCSILVKFRVSVWTIDMEATNGGGKEDSSQMWVAPKNRFVTWTGWKRKEGGLPFGSFKELQSLPLALMFVSSSFRLQYRLLGQDRLFGFLIDSRVNIKHFELQLLLESPALQCAGHFGFSVSDLAESH